MKGFFLTIAVAFTFLLSGCHGNSDADISAYIDDIAKSQKIDVISADTSEIIETITAKEDINDFVLALEIEKWESKSLPKKGSKVGSFDFSQEQTIKFGESSHKERFSHIATITVYDSSYICLDFGGFDMAFKVSPDTADYLNRYFA